MRYHASIAKKRELVPCGSKWYKMLFPKFIRQKEEDVQDVHGVSSHHAQKRARDIRTRIVDLDDGVLSHKAQKERDIQDGVLSHEAGKKNGHSKP